MAAPISQLTSRAESIVQARPDPRALRGREDLDPTAADTRAAPPEAPRALEEAAKVETRDDLSRRERSDRREIGRQLQAETERAGLAQAASQRLAEGRRAEQRDEAAVDAELRRGRADEAAASGRRLDEAARDPGGRQTVERATEVRTAPPPKVPEPPPIEPQPTLALVPQGLARADEDEEARSADAGARRTREGADSARPAAAQAISPSQDLASKVRTLGDQAAQRSRALTASFAGGRPRAVTTSQEAARAAEQAARTILEDPGRALATQPFLTVEAALRVLA